MCLPTDCALLGISILFDSNIRGKRLSIYILRWWRESCRRLHQRIACTSRDLRRHSQQYLFPECEPSRTQSTELHRSVAGLPVCSAIADHRSVQSIVSYRQQRDVSLRVRRYLSDDQSSVQSNQPGRCRPAPLVNDGSAIEFSHQFPLQPLSSAGQPTSSTTNSHPIVE